MSCRRKEKTLSQKSFILRSNNEPVIFQQPLDYMDAYNDLLLKVRRLQSLLRKRSKMKELEQAKKL